MRRRTRVTALLAAMAMLAAVGASCSDGGPSQPADVVVSTDIVGSLTAAVAGPSATVTVLADEADARTYRPDDVAFDLVVEADIVVLVGGGYEIGMADAIAAARRDGVVVLELLDELAPVPYGTSPAYEAGQEGEGGTVPTGDGAPALGDPDPAFWLDADRALQAGRDIARVLDERAPELATVTAVGLANLEADLTTADEDAQAALLPLPDDRRLLVTDDPYLSYFAERYGLRLTAPGPDRAATDVVLFTDALGPAGSGADTVPGMVTTNATNISASLSAP
jgi:ABC-type Zn uptake system ZnuABC Zn-binding protein ZnuA